MGEILIAFELFPSHPGLLRGWAASHPLWPSTRLPVVVTLACAVGLASIARRSPVRFAVLGTLLLLLAPTLPAAWPRVGVRWSFRLPLYGLALVVAGSALLRSSAACDEAPTGSRWRGDHRRRAGLHARRSARRGRECRAPDPEMTERRWLRSALADLPRPAILIGFDEGSAAWRLPAVLGARAGIQVQRYDDPPAAPPADGPPYVLFEGLGCYNAFPARAPPARAIRPRERAHARGRAPRVDGCCST